MKNRLYELLEQDEYLTSIELLASNLKLKIDDVNDLLNGEKIGHRKLKKILKHFNCSEDYFYYKTDRRND
ncbi:MAG: hypothetical protein IJU60_00480 [Acholeplasmatales bacterium]|nr:hypothetical protein [Acholeplasmatales bacterium]